MQNEKRSQQELNLSERIHIVDDPFIFSNDEKSWRERGKWPAWWIGYAEMDAPVVAAYRLNFVVESAATITIHVTADEKYRLWLDGERIGSGPESGDPANWYFDSYVLNLDAGEHCLVALVWAKGALAGLGQMSVRPGFLLAEDPSLSYSTPSPNPSRREGDLSPLPRGGLRGGELLNTGVARWEMQKIEGITFTRYVEAHLREGMTHIDGHAMPWGFEHGEGVWGTAVRLGQGMGRPSDFDIHHQHWLTPATLPAQREAVVSLGIIRHAKAQSREGQAKLCDFAPLREEIRVQSDTIFRMIIDLESYLCAYPIVTTSGGAGAIVTVKWCEALRYTADVWTYEKGNRNEIEGKFFVGCGNRFVLDGGVRRVYEPLEWNAGRYVEVVVETADQPATIHTIQFRTVAYPLEIESQFACSDDVLNRLVPVLTRGVTASTHDVYGDSPHFEQTMYAGDARIELLCTYVLSRETALPRKVIHLFNASRLPSGFIQARYPSRAPQLIAPFTVWWIGMVHDFLYWRDDVPFVRGMMAGVRSSAEAFLAYQSAYQNGVRLITPLPGWLFFDWVPEWESGIPAGALDDVHGLVNWQVVYGWSLVADLETHVGEPELAALWERRTAELAAACAVFWDDERGLMADDVAHTRFSEHTQTMAILSGRLTPHQQERIAHGLRHDPDLTRTTVYFSHYLFEAYQRVGAVDLLLLRLDEWREMLRDGLLTPREKLEPSRSDCHGWSSHPLYHFYATVCGIRPTSPAFRTHTVTPQLGDLSFAHCRMAVPHGAVVVSG